MFFFIYMNTSQPKVFGEIGRININNFPNSPKKLVCFAVDSHYQLL